MISMKKFLSVILSVIIGCSVTAIGFTVTVAEKNEENSINSFISGITELAREYDADKNFEAVEGNTAGSNVIMPFSAYADETSLTENEFSPLDFQTARLIVRASGNFNELGALEHISGFEDFHILQYESPETAMKAYEHYENDENIISVAPDEVIFGLQGDVAENLVEKSFSDKDYLCEWSVDRTQSKRLQDYLRTAKIPMREVVVGVIDTGVDYDHEFLKGRLVLPKTNFPNSQTSENDEASAYKSHGTAVSSVIVDNTPENVKITMYNGFDETGNSTQTRLATSILAAVNDGVDLINASWTAFDNKSNVITESLDYAYENNIPVFACVGNDDGMNMHFLPANKKECIAVAATDSDNTATDWNILTPNADVSAPGQDINVATFGNTYDIWKGTSFSTPCVASLGAILLSVNPDMTVDALKARLKETVLPVKYQNFYHSSQGKYFDNVESLYVGDGMIQFCDAFGLEDNFAVPEIHMETKVYVGKQKCEITCEDKNVTILYTTNGAYPDLQNATVYTKPFTVTERTRIRTVAYYADGGYYGDETESTPRIQYTDNDDAFEIDADGVITKYTGNITDLYVQEKINGITVTGIAPNVFSYSYIRSLTLPETVTEIQDNALDNDITLEFIRAPGVIYLHDSFLGNNSLMYVEFPKLKIIENGTFSQMRKFYGGDFSSVESIKRAAFQYSNIRSFYGPQVKELAPGAFNSCNVLEKVYFPQVSFYTGIPVYGIFEQCNFLRKAVMPSEVSLPLKSFQGSKITEAYFPVLKKMGSSVFYNCACLEDVYMPSLLDIPKRAFGGNEAPDPRTAARTYVFDSVKSIREDAFGFYPTKRAEFSHLETAQSLPQTEYLSEPDLYCILAMPSTFTKCTENTKGRNYKVYGTKGTYAEIWANENGHEFIEISQETALLQDVPMEYTSSDELLAADVIGFNKTYQWYGNTVADNTAGRPIEGATGKDFNPADYDAYPYYYCVVTSTDVGYEPVEIRTGVTANKEYHSYTVLQHNDTQHWYKCDSCDLTTTPENHYGGTATCTEKAICELCNTAYGEPLGHTLGEWETVTSPTCTEKGLEKRSCADCEYEETRDITAIAHDLIHHDAKIPTCTEIGWNEYDTCSRCDYSTCAELSALGHAFSEWSIIKESTETEEGLKKRACTICCITETEAIPILPFMPTEPTTEQLINPDIPHTGMKVKSICTLGGAITMSIAFVLVLNNKKKYSSNNWINI